MSNKSMHNSFSDCRCLSLSMDIPNGQREVLHNGDNINLSLAAGAIRGRSDEQTFNFPLLWMDDEFNWMGARSRRGPADEFLHVLESLSDEDLNTLTEYFRPDLVGVVEENIDAVLGHLITSNIITHHEAKQYAHKQEHNSATLTAKRLVTEVVEKRRGAKHLWRGLYSERYRFRSPNLEDILRVMQREALGYQSSDEKPRI
ncbi:uncharacterized protein LOC122795053 [Protopterus annectens]|uniref:uncharacterized protein LOC122795053 n=1 Tax=Protopterus annectens TaxID=7888 RepID=UPI001CF9A612|nr:uncharacterized protein LOC122795053 [Protopterus annectens]